MPKESAPETAMQAARSRVDWDEIERGFENDVWQRGISLGPFQAFFQRRCFWFRIFGYGLSLQRYKSKLFSERYGYKRVLRFKSFSLEAL